MNVRADKCQLSISSRKEGVPPRVVRGTLQANRGTKWLGNGMYSARGLAFCAAVVNSADIRVEVLGRCFEIICLMPTHISEALESQGNGS